MNTAKSTKNETIREQPATVYVNQNAGGFPDVNAQSDGQSMTYKDAGDYYVSALGTGNWTASVEEER